MPKTDGEPLIDIGRPLEEISERKFREVIELLEKARANPGVQRVLDQARPRLRRVRPPRPPSVRRLFYLPVEDLLSSDPDSVAAGLIGRSTVALAWQYLQAHGDPVQWQAVNDAFEEALGAEAGTEAMEGVGRRLWGWAGAAIASALKASGADRGVRAALMGDDKTLFPEMERLAILLQLGGEVEAMKAALPLKPVRALTTEQLQTVREFIQQSGGGVPERVFALAMAVAARMAVPAEFIKPFSQMNLGLTRIDQQALAERLQDVTLAGIDRTARRVEETRALAPLSRADEIRSLVLAVAAAQQSFRVEGQAKRELLRLRAGAERAVGEIVEEAGSKVIDAVETGAGGAIDHQIDTENNLLALRKCQSFAGAIGLDGKVSDTLGRIAGNVRRRTGTLFAGLAGPGLPSAAPGVPEATPEEQIYWAVRMMELAGNADEADRIRRDGMELLRQYNRRG